MSGEVGRGNLRGDSWPAFQKLLPSLNIDKFMCKTISRNPFEIQIFKNERFGQIRTIVNEKGETFFVGKDVAKALGYSKPLNAVAMHVEEDDSLKWGLIDSKGRKQQTILINESGLYSLILASKLEQAKAFKRWVTSEVLPQIRMTPLNVNKKKKGL